MTLHSRGRQWPSPAWKGRWVAWTASERGSPSLGYPSTLEAFESNDVALDLLQALTDQDLRELGVQSLGHRKRLLKAIAELNSAEAPTRVPPAEAIRATPATPTPAPASATTEGERRQLTVMFCDLVGSTAAVRAPRSGGAARRHPRLPGLRGARHRALRGPRRAVPGRWAAGLLRLSRAHEDDAERAVRAGPGNHLRDASNGMRVSMHDAQARLSVRIGIHTGVVVVGDIGGGARQRAARAGRHAQPRGAAAGAGRARHRGDQRAHAPACRWQLRVLPTWATRPQGHLRSRSMPGASPGSAPRPAASRPRPDAGLTPAGGARAGDRAAHRALASSRRRAKARWCCSRASRASASRAS